MREEASQAESKDGHVYAFDYAKVKLELGSDLEHLGTIARALDLVDGAAQIEAVHQRLIEDKFTVAIIGEFKRGKSTFLNALLGVDVLPTDVLPCSATLNRVTYGLKPRVTLKMRDGSQSDIDPNELHAYVTKLTPESEEVAATVGEAVVYYPSEYCRDNVDVFDTPGLNDDDNMTMVTLSVLPQIDAAVMVISATSPFGKYEMEFLETKLLAADLGRVVFVVTRIDDLSPTDADRVVTGIAQRIERFVVSRAEQEFGASSAEFETYRKKIGKPRVFGISARQALEAKLTRNDALLQQSRMPVFERALHHFLAHGRGAVTLQVPVNRILASAREILDALALRQSALGLKRDEFEVAYKKAEAEIAEIDRRKTEELREIRKSADAAVGQIADRADGLVDALLRVATKTVDEFSIKPEQISDTKALGEKVGGAVKDAVRLEADRRSQEIQVIVQRALAAEVERLGKFEEELGGLMAKLGESFGQGAATGLHGGTGAVVAGAAAVFLGFGGIWSGYREAGTKGALVGGLASAGTALAGGVLLAIFALPVSFPVIVGLALASILPGKWTARYFFPGERIEKFRAEFKERVLVQLREKLEEADLRLRMRDQVRGVFEGLREKVEQEADTTLADARQSLLSLRAQYERDRALTDHDKAQLDAFAADAAKIAESAARRSRELAQLMEI